MKHALTGKEVNSTTASISSPLRSRTRLAGDVAKQLGIGVQTLHFYEREALIPPPVRSESGYRLYTSALVERVAFIRKAQALGLPLEEIRHILALADEGSSPCGRVERALTNQLAEVDHRIAELRNFRADLAGLVTRARELCGEGSANVCAIVEGAVASLGGFRAQAPLARSKRETRSRPHG